MGETLTSGAEAALVNRLRGRGRPKKTHIQKQEVNLQQSIIEEEASDYDNEKAVDDLTSSDREGFEYELDRRYSRENSPLPPTPPLEGSGALSLSSSTPKRTNTSRRDLSLEVPPGMDFLMSYMKSLHEKTENTMMKMVDASKMEINHNLDAKVTKLSADLQGMKSDVYRIESTMEGKLQKIEEAHRGLDMKVDESSKEIKRIEQMQRAEKTGTKSKIRSLEQEISADREKYQNDIESLRAEIKGMAEANNQLIKEYESTLQGYRDEMAECKKQNKDLEMDVQLSIDELKMTAFKNKEDIRQNTLQLDGLENRSRSSNLVIEGLPEDDDKKTLKEQVGDIFRLVFQDFKDQKIKSAYRIGKARGKKKKPRLAIIVMENSAEKETILAKAAEIKNKSGNQSLWLNQDQTDSNKRKHRLVRACYKKLVENDHQCSIKGSLITYQQKQYDYEMLSLLPQGCKPEDIKTRETNDGKGLAFQSDHVYLSNMAPARFRYNKCLYTSAEHAFQTTRVRALGFIQLAQEMQLMCNPYYIKKIADGVEPTSEKLELWQAKEEKIMTEIIRQKFLQNQHLMDKLKNDAHEKYYEMTTDQFWATGQRLPADDAVELDPTQFTGKNRTGEILSSLKQELEGHGRVQTTD